MPVFRSRKNRRFSRSHVLDVKLSARHRREVRTRWLTTGLGVAIGVAAVIALVWRGGIWFLDEYVYRNAVFAIKGIEVQTDGVIAHAQVLRWAGVKEVQNLLALDLGRVKQDLEMVPTIRKATVERVLPNALRVRISERQPIAQFVYARPGGAGGYTRAVCLLDREGFLMQPLEASQRAAPAPSFSNLPMLTGLSLRDLVPGRRVSSHQVIDALRLIEAFRGSPMAQGNELRQIDLTSPGVLQASTAPYGEIVFRAQGFDQQLQRWGAIEAFGRRGGKRLATLDLSVSNNIPATWLAGDVSSPGSP